MAAMYLKAFVALFVVMDPIGNIPTFLAVTRTLDRRQQRKAYALSVLIAFAILMLFGLTGQLILDRVFQIKIADLQISGGILLFLVAIKQLLTHHSPESNDSNTALNAEEIACVPLACPLLAGPGALITILTLWHSPSVGPLASAVAVVSVLGLFWLLMRTIETISRMTGKLIITVVSKIMLILVAAIAVKMTITGIQFYFPANG